MPFAQTCPEQVALAYHEAGHAVVAQSIGAKVFYVTVRPRYDCAGHVRHAAGAITIRQALLITLAGCAAGRRHFPLLDTFSGDLDDHIGQFDTEQARALLRVLLGCDRVSNDLITVELARWRVPADRAVTQQWSWITAVAQALVERQRLSGDEIARLNPEQRRTAWA